ncbi:MAG: C39 family peptidase [Ktedonobacteraceae bacterium]|nr:C39 family peptidase [Ktedonobacteraceae bacterium]MBO0792112.1 C39 family peptidase [Ktedonobacteraceae bacterium]
MFILLLTLLGIALVITFVGLCLSSPNAHTSSQRVSQYAGRGGPARRSRESVAYGARGDAPLPARSAQIRASRYAVSAERRGMAMSVNMADILRWRNGKPSSWLGALFVLLALFSFCLVTLKTLSIGPGLIVDTSLSDSSITATAVQKAKTSDPFASLAGASKALVRLGQLDRAQYASQDEYSKWANSACSTAAMTEVINAYGHHYRITDILKVEAGIGEITPELGLVEPVGVDRTVERFGFKAVWLTNSPLDKIIKVANDGRPVIVGWPPERWSGGHILVLRGGNNQNVYLADSSLYNYQVMSRSRFTQLWAGFAVAVVPR